MKTIRYRVRLEEPALLTALDGDPNEGVSFNHIPGSVLRGAVIGRYLRENRLSELDLTGAERECFFEGRLRFLNAYPVIGSTRAYPVPFSWHRFQNETGSIHDDLWSPSASVHEKPKRVGASFHLRQADKVRLCEPERHIAVHIQRDRRGRPTAEGGALYRYESLAAGQVFEAAILCEVDADIDWLLPLLSGSFWIGGARTAGYGRCTWSLEGDPLDEWREGPLDDDQGKWVLVLMSNAILRDAYGQYAADLSALTAHLENRLGCRPEIIGCQLDSEMVGGFNRKWGLPLPQTLSVKMGSVLRFNPCDGNWDRLIAEGIGERRAEGFGRMTIYRQANDRFSVLPEQGASPVEPVVLEGAEFATAQRISRRIYEERLQRQLKERANDVSNHVSGKPSHSQLGELRQVISAALRQSPVTTQPVTRFLADARQTRAKQFEEFRLEKQDLNQWLQQKAGDGLSGIPAVEIGGTGASSLDNATYTLRLLDAILIRLMRNTAGRGD